MASEDWGGDTGGACECPQCGDHTTERDLDVHGVCPDCWNGGEGWVGEGWDLASFPPKDPTKWKDR